MKYDFDTVVDRRGTNCAKHDGVKSHQMPENVIPLWVADMDFQTALPIREKLAEKVAHGVFGYPEAAEEFYLAVKKWYGTRFHWKIEREWIIGTPGVVFGFSAAIRAFTSEGDGILIQRPVYHPFSFAITRNHRKIVNSPLVLKDGHYEIDFEDFEQKIITENVKLFLLCSPHNPISRVWTEDELRKIGEICLRHHVMVVSDEIHSDFTFPGVTHHIFASLSRKFADNCIICTAPSKTFNLAGLQVSNIIIPNRTIREKYTEEIRKTGYGGLNMMGMAACQAAYEEGAEWLDQLLEYLNGNYELVRDYLKENLPMVSVVRPEGTYLLWMDFRKLGLTEEELEDLIVNQAGLWLDGGAMFGEEGTGFERVNIACPRSVLNKALKQLKQAIEQNMHKSES